MFAEDILYECFYLRNQSKPTVILAMNDIFYHSTVDLKFSNKINVIQEHVRVFCTEIGIKRFNLFLAFTLVFTKSYPFVSPCLFEKKFLLCRHYIFMLSISAVIKIKYSPFQFCFNLKTISIGYFTSCNNF